MSQAPGDASGEKSEQEPPSTTLEGEFEPPRMGRLHTPIRMAGPGELEIKPTELVATGHPAKRSWWLILLFVGIFVGIIALALALDLSSVGRNVSVGIGLAVFLGIALNRGSRYREDREMIVNASWENVEWIRASGPGTQGKSRPDVKAGEVQILLEGGDPEGTLHFYPTGRTWEAAQLLREANTDGAPR